MLTLLMTSALAATDEIGGDETYNNDGNALKLVAFDVAEAAVVTRLEFAVYNYYSDGDVSLVLYVWDGGGWSLVQANNATNLPASEGGWASSGDVVWLLEPGSAYAMGAWVGGDWYYYYDEGTPADPWFGDTTGSYRFDSDSPPPGFVADRENYIYWMRITSEDADVDGDGAIAVAFGGEDCRDDNPGISPSEAEVCGDGIDQDCSGADLPCDDTDTSGSGDSGDGDTATDDTAGGGGDTTGGGGDTTVGGGAKDGGAKQDQGGELDLPAGACGCAHGEGAPVGLGLGLAALLARRRRRG